MPQAGTTSGDVCESSALTHKQRTLLLEGAARRRAERNQDGLALDRYIGTCGRCGTSTSATHTPRKSTTKKRVVRWPGPVIKLPPNPKLVYLRKSKESAEAQRASHKRQIAQIVAKFGVIPEFFPGTEPPATAGTRRTGSGTSTHRSQHRYGCVHPMRGRVDSRDVASSTE